MKFRLPLTLLALLFVIGLKSQTPYSLTAQMAEINQEWSTVTNLPEVNLDLSHLSEKQKIKLHLKLVEGILKEKSTAHLTASQKLKRQECLSILNNYWNAGTFPINLHHANRTPYFIDHLGTHCAVGYLMKQTGFGESAMQIQKENNYSYLYDLAIDYSDIHTWADLHGFTLQELAWIQPGYPLCTNDCDEGIIVYVEDYDDQYVGEISFYWPEFDLTAPIIEELCLGEGYEVIVTDSLGTVVDASDVFYFLLSQSTILQPVNGMVYTQPSDLAQVEFSSTKSTGYCDGSVSFELQNAVQITDVTWLDYPEASGTELSGICSGWYHVDIETNYECHKLDSIFVKPDFDLCLGDLNFDFYSNSGDLSHFLGNFGCLENCAVDLDDDDKTTAGDLGIFLGHFGVQCEFGVVD